MDIKTQNGCPLVMGILNVTPDSFSGDGLLTSNDCIVAAVKQAEKMLEDGADILDIGGESSRPGHEEISVDEEIHRTIPVISAIKDKVGERAIISIDTIKPDVAAAAIKAGANIINDISGMRAKSDMYKLAAENDAYIVLMHNNSSNNAVNMKAGIGKEYAGAECQDVATEVFIDLKTMIGMAKEAGVSPQRMIVDPGIGFGKTVEQNLKLINQLDKLKKLGCLVMIGPSRKYFIGQTLNLPVEDRLEGTAAAIAVSVMKGADIVRVHDVKSMSRVSRMAYAIKKS